MLKYRLDSSSLQSLEISGFVNSIGVDLSPFTFCVSFDSEGFLSDGRRKSGHEDEIVAAMIVLQVKVSVEGLGIRMGFGESRLFPVHKELIWAIDLDGRARSQFGGSSFCILPRRQD